MEERTVAVEKAVETLNDALRLDPDGVNALFGHRVECNEKLADHETIQVSSPGGAYGREYTSMGALGIINGIFGIDADHYGAIQVVIEGEDNRIIRFEDNGRDVGHEY